MRDYFLNLPSTIREEFQKYFKIIDVNLTSLQERANSIRNGKRKRQLCDWWLNYIETECEKFLADNGFNKHCIPDDYMDIAPKDPNIVKENLELLQNLMRVDSENLKLTPFVSRVITEVYVVLDEFIAEIEFVLAETRKELNCSAEMTLSLVKDLEYLIQMKKMDEEIRNQDQSWKASRKLEMSDVVPIGGLVMARLHVVECELRTALEVWGHMSPTCSRETVLSTEKRLRRVLSYTPQFLQDDEFFKQANVQPTLIPPSVEPLISAWVFGEINPICK
jgi:hypothetical protein